MKYRLKDICNITKGATGIMKADGGKYPLVALSDERRNHSEFQFDAKAVIVPLISSTGHGHASMKRVHYQEGKFALGNILCAVIPNDEKQLNAKYLHLYLQQFKETLLVPLMKGAANVSLPMNKLADIEIEVPRLERQLDIIALEEKAAEYKNELEEKLKFQDGDVTKLRQAILKEALQGKLVKQNSKEGNASDLLNKTREEREKLVKAKKIKPLTEVVAISDSEIAFDIPDSWCWTRLSELLFFSNDSMRRGPFGSSITKGMFIPKSPKSTKVYEQKNAIYKNFELGDYFIDLEEQQNLKSFLTYPGDIIISCAGTIGETYVLPDNAPIGIINQALLKIKLNNSIILNDFFLTVFKSLIKERVNDDAVGSAMKNLGSIKYLKENLIIPLPHSPNKIAS